MSSEAGSNGLNEHSAGANMFIRYATRYPACLEAQAAQLALDSLNNPEAMENYSRLAADNAECDYVAQIAGKAHSKGKEGWFKAQPDGKSVETLSNQTYDMAQKLRPFVKQLPSILGLYDKTKWQESNTEVIYKIRELLNSPRAKLFSIYLGLTGKKPRFKGWQ